MKNQEGKDRQFFAHLLVDYIDAVNDVELSRSGSSIYDTIDYNVFVSKGRAVLDLEKRYPFTERERQILRYLADERNPSYIAKTLNISPSTVKAHKYSIFKKLVIHSTKEFKMLCKAGKRTD